MNAAHPAFAHILDAIQQQPVILRLAAYRSMLRRTDVGFAHGSSRLVFMGSAERIAELQEEQQRVDPERVIWNAELAARRAGAQA